MLHSLLAYARGAGVDVRWMTISGNPDFFKITKRIHNNLHEAPGDGGPLGPEERKIYEAALLEAADELARLVQPGDIVYVHDPQPAGLVPHVKTNDLNVVWRCHIGVDSPGELARSAWDFLRPDVADADAYVFSRKRFVWEGLDTERVWIVPPSIDAFSPKNQELEPAGGSLDPGGDRPRGGRPLQPRDLSPLRRQRRPRRPCCADRSGRAGPQRRSDDHPGVSLGQAQGPGRGARVLRRILQGRRCASRARRAVGRRGLRRPGGRRGARGGPRATQRPAGGSAGAGPPRLPPDGRRAGERGDGQRDPAAFVGDPPEEPRRGLRADRRRGDVEGEADGGEPGRRDSGPDRGRGLGRADRRPDRSRVGRASDRRLPLGPPASGSKSATRRARGCSSTSSARATSSST